MSLPDWTEAPLARHHDRKAFDCGEPALNEYLARYAGQNHESGGAKTFIASPVDEPSRVLGYYTLAPASLAYARFPSFVTRGLGRYEVPVFRLGRLAVDRSVQGQGLGARLLLAEPHAEHFMRLATSGTGWSHPLSNEWSARIRYASPTRRGLICHSEVVTEPKFYVRSVLGRELCHARTPGQEARPRE